ncbi:MAG: UbiA family prenyltransferase [Mycobacteriales bacterium]
MRTRPPPGLRLPPLLRASHPEPVFAVTVVTTALATQAGRSASGLAGVAAAVLAGQLSVGWCNDWCDRDRDRRAGRPDKPVARGEVAAPLVLGAAVTALALAVALSLWSGWRAALVHAAALGLAWGYNLGLKATVASVLPYAAAFGALPAFVTLGLAGHPGPPAWAVAAGALLGAGAHFANTLPDIAADLAAGVRGLPQRVGPTGSGAAATALLIAALLVVTLGPGRPGPLVATGAVVAGVVGLAGLVAGQLSGSRGAFRAMLVVAVIDVALLLARGTAV